MKTLTSSPTVTANQIGKVAASKTAASEAVETNSLSHHKDVASLDQALAKESVERTHAISTAAKVEKTAAINTDTAPESTAKIMAQPAQQWRNCRKPHRI